MGKKFFCKKYQTKWAKNFLQNGKKYQRWLLDIYKHRRTPTQEDNDSQYRLDLQEDNDSHYRLYTNRK